MTPIETYISQLDQPKRSTLTKMRELILDVIPDAEETFAYNIPTFKMDGKSIIGIAAFKDHCSCFPFSGWVVEHLAGELTEYSTSKGTIRFAVDRPLPKSLVAKVIKARLAQLSQAD